MKPLDEAFIQFVKKQPPKKPINHTGWDACAVGEFANSINYPARNHWFGPGSALKNSGEISEEVLDWICGAITYGDAQERDPWR